MSSRSWGRLRAVSGVLCLAASGSLLAAEPIAAVQPADAGLDCAGIAAAQRAQDEVIAAGDPNSPNFGKAAAGTAANVGGQIAGGVVAQSVGGLFGAFGGVVSKVTGAVAQQAAEEKMGPDEAARQRAAEASTRQRFLAKLAIAKECRKDDPAFAGRTLTPAEFAALSAAPERSGELVADLRPFALPAIEPLLAAPLSPLGVPVVLDNQIKVAGKQKLHVSEFRVLFEVGGEVSARTRAGYMPGVHYGGTSSRINYQVKQPDLAVYQAITDKAWADLQARLATTGLALEPTEAFVAAHGAVYDASEMPSLPGAPVYVEEDLGYTSRKYLVMAPTSMKLHPRGFAGLGAGNIGKRIEWVKGGIDGLMISVAVNIAALESSGGGSSILNRDGASTQAGEGLTITTGPKAVAVQGQADAGAIYLKTPIVVPGTFANFRAVGGYDSRTDGVARSMTLLSNLSGVAANQSKKVEMEIDLDGPASSRLMLAGLATFNQAIAEALKGRP